MVSRRWARDRAQAILLNCLTVRKSCWWKFRDGATRIAPQLGVLGRSEMRKGMSIIAMAITLTVTACHRQGDSEPLARQTIYCWDKFFDVEALVAGYGGKLLETTDDGLTFHRQPTGRIARSTISRRWATGSGSSARRA